MQKLVEADLPSVPTVLQRLSDAGVNAYTLAREALCVLFEIETEFTGAVGVAKGLEGYQGLVASLRELMADRRGKEWPTVVGWKNLLKTCFGRSTSVEQLTVALLHALDEELFRELQGGFEEHLKVNRFLVEGDLIVLPEPSMLALASGNSVTMSRENTASVYETHRLRRFPGPPPGVKVELIAHHGASLTATLGIDGHCDPSQVLRFASATPTDRDTPRRQPSDGFAPTIDSGALRVAKAIVKQAVDAEVRVLVLPELSLPDESSAISVMAGWGRRPGIVVPGSTVVQDLADPQRFWNRAQVWMNGRPTMTHTKIHLMYAAAQPKLNNGEATWGSRAPERCIPGDTLTLLWSPEWIVAVLICSDLNDSGLRKVLSDVQANLILVPFLTPKLDDFRRLLSGMVSSNQAVVVTSNSHPPGDGVGGGNATSALYTPMEPDPWWHDDAVGLLRQHQWLPTSESR